MEKVDKAHSESQSEEKASAPGLSYSAPAFNVTASGDAPMQRQTPAEGDNGSSVQQRYADHSLTEADLSDAWVIEQFAALDIEALFEYRRQCTNEAVKAHLFTLIDGRERDPYQSYLGKRFTINDPQAVIRDRNGTEQTYQEGDEIPEGSSVGDNKIIPNGTEVYITDITEDLNRVYAEDWGWTNIGNIQGGMFNETVSIDRAEYESQDPNHKTVATHTCTIHSNTPIMGYPEVDPREIIPVNTNVQVLQSSDDNRYVQVTTESGDTVWTAKSNLADNANEDGTRTVTDSDARIRQQSAEYPAAGGTIPQGDRVIIVAESQDTAPVGRYVQVARTTQNSDGNYVRDENQEAVWIQANDLADNWADYQSDNARWRKSTESSTHGVYLGQMDVVKVIGQESSTGDQELESVSADLIPSYRELLDAATAAGHDMRINSAFRTYQEQSDLWDLYQAGTGNLAARPGRSNHQNGIAIDINTGGFNTALYNWMVTNGPTYDFIRTVSGEHWHWEYRPDDAAEHGYRMPGVSP